VVDPVQLRDAANVKAKNRYSRPDTLTDFDDPGVFNLHASFMTPPSHQPVEEVVFFMIAFPGEEFQLDPILVLLPDVPDWYRRVSNLSELRRKLPSHCILL
jgi:hypothetical protein